MKVCGVELCKKLIGNGRLGNVTWRSAECSTVVLNTRVTCDIPLRKCVTCGLDRVCALLGCCHCSVKRERPVPCEVPPDVPCRAGVSLRYTLGS